jgi:hypothetical protein
MYRVGTAPLPAGHELASPSPIVWLGSAPDIVLELTSGDSTVARNTEMEFQVKNVGRGGELYGVAIDWRFEPDSVQFYDNAVSPKFAPPVVYDTVDTDSTWAGTIVHPGKLIVTGVGPSNTALDTIIISVTPRSWGPATVLMDTAAFNSGQLALTDPGTYVVAGRFHAAPYGNGSFTDSTFFTLDSIQRAQVPAGGPNGGYWWVTSANVFMLRAYSLNDWIDPPGQGPYGTTGLTTTGWLISQGDSVAMMNLRADVIEHERGPGGSNNSHLERHNIAAASFPSCGDIVEAMERQVTATSGEMAGRVSDAAALAAQAIAFASSHEFVYGTYDRTPRLLAYWNPYGTSVSASDPFDDDGTPPNSMYCDASGL